MASEFFTDITSSVLSKTLDATAVRQRAIANNIANAETPGYKRSVVSFEDELQNVLKQSNKNFVREGLEQLSPAQQTDGVSPSRPDGNNVNIDAEMADLAKNSLEQRATVTLLEAKITMLRSAIKEGK